MPSPGRDPPRAARRWHRSATGLVTEITASGTPVEFPNDVALVNNGPGTVRKGTKIHWKLNNYAGDYVFAAALAKGSLVRISNVLGGGVAAGRPCTASKL